MKNCTHCKYAEWKRREGGNLHPNGEGMCTYPYKVPPLPTSMCWLYPSDVKPLGGYINRRKELDEHCTYYVRDGG